MAIARIFALTLFAAAPVLGWTPAATAATPEASDSAAKISIRAKIQHEGRSADAKRVSTLGKIAKLTAQDEEHAHDLEVTVARPEGSDAYAVTIGYARDGKKVLKSKTVEVRGESMTIEAGGTMITLELRKAKPRRAKIDMPEGDDPLAGL